jgi:hypothetical protein
VHPGREMSTQYFHARVGLVQIPQKRTGTHYAEPVFLHPVGSMDHVVSSWASEA